MEKLQRRQQAFGNNAEHTERDGFVEIVSGHFKIGGIAWPNVIK